MPSKSIMTGALVGWTRHAAEHGIILSLRLVRSRQDYQEERFHNVSIALNDRQLRSLTRDLMRSAGMEVETRPPWWHRLRSRGY